MPPTEEVEPTSAHRSDVEASTAHPPEVSAAEPEDDATLAPDGRRASMLPERRERPPLESAFVRVIATSGVVGIGVALGAILISQNVAGWITGLVIALVSVILSAILWSSRRL
jgi:hypothetical protein